MKGLFELSGLSSMVPDCSLDAANSAAPPPSSSFAVAIRGRMQTSLVWDDGTRLVVEIPSISYHPASGRVAVADAVLAQGDSLQTLENLRDVGEPTRIWRHIPTLSSCATTESPDSSSSFVVGGQITVHVPLVTVAILHPQRVVMHARDIGIDVSHRSVRYGPFLVPGTMPGARGSCKACTLVPPLPPP
jgi:hypothetical protein